MTGPANTMYVAIGDADVAYQVTGDGPADLLFCYGLGSHIEFNRQVPSIARFQDRLASFSRLCADRRRRTSDRLGIGTSSIVSIRSCTADQCCG